MNVVSPITRAPTAIAGRIRPIRQPGVGVRLGLIVVFAVVVLHCAVTLALLVHASRFVLALGSAGATLGARGQGADLIRTGLLWVALTLVACGAAVLVLRQRRVATRTGSALPSAERPPEIAPEFPV